MVYFFQASWQKTKPNDEYILGIVGTQEFGLDPLARDLTRVESLNLFFLQIESRRPTLNIHRARSGFVEWNAPRHATNLAQS
jgi:hypothetical protein